MEKGKILLLPPLIGGAVTVLASNIPPFSLLNLFFFFWFFAGGSISYYLAHKNPNYSEQNYDGALYGFFGGLFGWIFHSIFVLFLYLNGKFELDALVEKLNEFPISNKEDMINFLQQTGIERILIGGVLIMGAFYIGFGTLGGILGKKLFFNKNEKKIV